MTAISTKVKRTVLFGLVGLLLVGGTAGWVWRDDLRCWYYLRQLDRAEGETALEWAGKLAGLGDRGVSVAFALFRKDAPGGFEKGQAILSAVINGWGLDDPRGGGLVDRILKEFPRLTPRTRGALLRLSAAWVTGDGEENAELVTACGRLVVEASREPVAEVLATALELTERLVPLDPEPEVLEASRTLVRAGFRAGEASTRVRSVRLAVLPAVDLRKETLPLLRDPSAPVRHMVMLAVGENEAIIQTDALLPWLHDSNADVRRQCEASLRARGLTPRHIQMARLLTDKRWQVRASVLDHLDDQKLNSGEWIRRLTHDTSPAVRAAAVRAASETCEADLRDRIAQMANGDPSQTVSDLAKHYLREPKRGE
jgi:hypothetical protein